MGNTKNTREATLGLFEKELLNASVSNAQLSVIVLDGTPNTFSYEGELTNKETLFYSQDDYIRQIQCGIILSPPQEKEVDILSGLENAVEVLRDKAKDGDRKQILVYSSGISTTGTIDFSSMPELIYQTPENVITYAETKINQIDLSDIEVIWYGLGDVADSQKISELEKAKLQEIWEAILKKCGAEPTFKKYIAKDNEDERTIIESYIQENSLQVLNRDEYPIVSVANFKKFINLDSSLLEFIGDEDKLVNESDAEKLLKNYAEILQSFQNERIYIIGCTADDGTYEGCYNLSILRANVVKNILVKYGLNPNNLEVFGIGKYQVGGNNSVWRNDDSDRTDANQSLNRKVMILLENSDEGKLFRKQWQEYRKNHNIQHP